MVKMKRKKLATPRYGYAKLEVTLTKREAERLKRAMEKKGHKTFITRGALGHRTHIPVTRKAVSDYNKLTGRNFIYRIYNGKPSVWA